MLASQPYLDMDIAPKTPYKQNYCHPAIKYTLNNNSYIFYLAFLGQKKEAFVLSFNLASNMKLFFSN